MKNKKKTPRRLSLTDQDNLFRAWRWIRSNPDKTYKSYFREIYSIFALSDIANIKKIQEQLNQDTYEPSVACKIYLPKPSGILRPYTLLNIVDQVVYQSIINIIAEKLFHRVRSRYYISNFGNLYAGQRSIWFYRKWSTGYRQFNKEARIAFKSGLVYTASFDLTACYDSLDHKVLAHFLSKIGCSDKLVNLLLKCLSKWTSSENNHSIYHNHGIPQGPLSSGLLSEVVLQHFDQQMIKNKNIKYLRYVDDIRLFAKTPEDLKRQLVRLDLISKEIGLFPQSGKINIHKVVNIEDELKTISNPTSQQNSYQKNINQGKIIKKIIKLSSRYKISDITKFKYYLAQVKPNKVLNKRIWIIYSKYLSLYPNILSYFSKWDFLPKEDEKMIIDEIKKDNVYTSVSSAFVVFGSSKIDSKVMDKVIKSKWKVYSLGTDLLSSLGRHLVKKQLFNTDRQKNFAVNIRKSWYARAQIVRGMENNTIQLPKNQKIVNEKLTDSSPDVALTAAYLMTHHNLTLDKSIIPNINIFAINILIDFSYINKSASRNHCPIDFNLFRMFGYKMQQINWVDIFGSNYDWACKHIIYCRSLADTDVTAWVNAFDVFCDALIRALFVHDNTLGNLPISSDIGAIYSNKILSAKYPEIFTMFKNIHGARYKSRLSHAIIRKTQKPSVNIKYSFYTKAKPIVRKALEEIKDKW